MQKKLAKFLLLLFLMQTTQLGEFGRIPLLVTHYLQHKSLYSHTTIIGFLKMHYIDKTVVDADYAQDMQLPFKTPVNYNLTIPFGLPPEHISLQQAVSIAIVSPPGKTDTKISSGAPIRVFQPPKFYS